MSTVLALHGFAQNRFCFGSVLDDLEALGHPIGVEATVTIDLPGHGEARDDDPAMWQWARRTADALDDRPVVIGYSMGGRYALHLALAAPERIRALVLIGASPGIESTADREARRHRDHELADRVEQIGVEAFLDEWLELPMFADLPPHARFEAQRRSNAAGGLASSLRHAGTGSQDDLWPRLGELESLPVLAVAGSLDPAFATAARRIAELTAGQASLIPGARHAAHLVSPTATARIIVSWLADHADKASPTDSSAP